MTGSILWNGIAGLSAAALIFLLSYGNNPLSTAVMRALYSFFIVFAVVFAVRWLLGQAASAETDEARKHEDSFDKNGSGEEDKGRSIDFTTPDNDLPADFSPLHPPKLKTVNPLGPQELAKAVRHMSEK